MKEGERETKYSYVSCQCEEKQLCHRICIVFGNEESRRKKAGGEKKVKSVYFILTSKVRASERTSDKKKQ